MGLGMAKFNQNVAPERTEVESSGYRAQYNSFGVGTRRKIQSRLDSVARNTNWRLR